MFPALSCFGTLWTCRLGASDASAVGGLSAGSLLVMKTCSKCYVEKLESEFHRRGKILKVWCKDCSKTYDAERFQKNSRKMKKQTVDRRNTVLLWMRSMKEAPCTDCGRCFHPVCMDFDHLRDKEFGIGDSIRSGLSPTKILKEIEKCELVCSNCHRLRTHLRREQERESTSNDSSIGRASDR